MEADITSKQFGISKLFSEGWRLYRANFTNILWVTLCVYIPVNVLASFIPTDALIQEYGIRGIQLYFNILRLIEFFIGTIAVVGIAAIVEKALQGTMYSWRDALRYGLSKWKTAIGTGFLRSVILLGLTLLLIIPGIIWSGYYAFWIYVVALRNIGGKRALDYSKSLVEGQWWRVFGIFLVFWITSFVASLIVTLPLNLISDNQVFGIIPGTIADIIGTYFAVVATVFFLNNDYRIKPGRIEQATSPAIESEA